MTETEPTLPEIDIPSVQQKDLPSEEERFVTPGCIVRYIATYQGEDPVDTVLWIKDVNKEIFEKAKARLVMWSMKEGIVKEGEKVDYLIVGTDHEITRGLMNRKKNSEGNIIVGIETMDFQITDIRNGPNRI